MALSESVVQRLRQAAVAASEHAYCPYSGFLVGAAVLVDDGTIFPGANVENASLGLTICAERNAIFQAVARGHRRIEAVAVFTPTGSPTPPCGACRQVIHEFGPDAEILCFANGEATLRYRLSQLLPTAFGNAALPPRDTSPRPDSG